MKKIYTLSAAAAVAMSAVAAPTFAPMGAKKTELFSFERAVTFKAKADAAQAPYQWENAGEGMMADGWIISQLSYTDGTQANPLEMGFYVTVEKAVGVPGLFRLVDPFYSSNYPLYNQGILADTRSQNIVIDATDPDLVVVMPQLSGASVQFSGSTELYEFTIGDFCGLYCSPDPETVDYFSDEADLVVSQELKDELMSYLTQQGYDNMISTLELVDGQGWTIGIPAPLIGYRGESFGYVPVDTESGYTWYPSLVVLPEGAYAGVSDLTVEDENAPVEYFNLQGVRVENPSNGLYIRRQGNVSTKVLVK